MQNDSDWQGIQKKVLFQVFMDLGAPEALVDFLLEAPCDHGLMLCNQQGEVTELTLASSFGGKISKALGRLPHLEVINLSRNGLHGSIPPELGRLQHLHTLYLTDNELTGRIPKELGNLSGLRFLDLSNNQLDGEIPAELGELDLRALSLGMNRFTGGLPPELGRLNRLTVLSVRSNQLSGEIPRELAQLEHLEVLSLAWNQFEGNLPPQLGNLRMLDYIGLDHNQLVGEIPKEWAELEQLKNLLLNWNQLTGIIPKELSKLQKLEWLCLNQNQLTGTIPAEFRSLKSLRFLALYQNELTGSIPAELSELQNLQQLLLFHNRLTGKIPPELGRLKALRNLSLYDNQLQGPVPPELAELSELRQLLLGQNLLEGRIPALQLQHLEKLVLDQNKLTGGIPKELLQKGLQILQLGDNQLRGHIPQELGQMNLSILCLQRNQFTGQIPGSLGQLKDLKILRLDNNQLTGEIPESIWQLTHLEALHLAKNRLRGAVPKNLHMKHLGLLDLRSNFLRGNLPHFGAMESLKHVDFSENLFAGPLASFVESLCVCCEETLEQLRLSHNLLKGIMPPCLLKLKRLTHLALNNNHLSGCIPEIKAADLVVLTLHENQLTGSIPQSLQDLRHLAVLTLHENSLDGQISALSLTGPCLDNPNFKVRGVPCLGLRQFFIPFGDEKDLHFYNNTASVHDCEKVLARYQYSGDEVEAILKNCPRLCNLCEKYQSASARATFHHNRISCEVPTSISNTSDVFATVVMGNMLGHGRDLAHVSWIAAEENQAFLYYSPEIWGTNVFLLCTILALAIVAAVFQRWLQRRFALALRCLNSGSTSRMAASNLALLRAAASTALICGPLLLSFLASTGYYVCAPPLSEMTIANLREDDFAEFVVVVFWSFATLLFHSIVASMPAAPRSGEPPKARTSTDSRVSIFSFDPQNDSSSAVVLDIRRIFAWLLWIALVSLFSLPSILFAVAQALPAKNSSGFSEDVLSNFHRMAPFLIVGIDMFLASPLSHFYSSLSGIKADRLLMTFRLFAAWLLSLMTTVFLHENCFAGWKQFWSVCEKGSPDHQLFNWHIWGEQILDTDKDMCQLRERWWAGGRCSRSIVENLNALMLKKLLIRCTVQPLVLLLLWRFSRLESADPADVPTAINSAGRHLRLFWGKGPKISGSLAPLQQMATMTTFMETLFFWSPLVPLISVGMICIAAANLFLFDVGVWIFHVQMPATAIHQRPAVSRSYLTFSLAASCGFQLWHVFGTQMCGRYLLLALNLALFLPVKRWMLPVEWARGFFWGEMLRANEAEVVELSIRMDLS